MYSEIAGIHGLQHTLVETTGEDLDDYVTYGCYYFSEDTKPANIPAGNGMGWLLVLPSSSLATLVKQVWIRGGSMGQYDHQMFHRTYNGASAGGSWSNWYRLLVQRDLFGDDEYDLSSYGGGPEQAIRDYLRLAHIGPVEDSLHKITQEDDLDDYVDTGVYMCTSSTIAASLINGPYTSGGFRLIVGVGTIDDSLIQVAIANSTLSKIFTRVRGHDGTWGNWKQIAHIDTVYPVGAVYTSTVSISPASQFGGSWEQIKGRFLLATGKNVANTSTTFGSLSANAIERPVGELGGTTTVTLTTSQIPSHTHDITVSKSSNTGSESTSQVVYGKPTGTVYTNDNAVSATGSGQAHTNMPPYLVVYMWKRVA